MHDDVPPLSETHAIAAEQSGIEVVRESPEPVLIETVAVMAAEPSGPSNEPVSSDPLQPEPTAGAEVVEEVPAIGQDVEKTEEEENIDVTTDGGSNDDDMTPPRPVAVVLPLTRQPKAEAGGEARVPVATTLQRVLRLAAARGAGTVYVVANTAPLVRIDGEFSTLEGEPALSAAFVDRLLSEVAPSARGASPAAEWLIDVPEIGRVRCVAFRDHRGPGVIFRMVPARAISPDQLGLSAEVQALCSEADGLILVTGGRGSGKSTLLTSFVDLINRTRSDHIITAESQIDFVHEHKRSFISQREVRGEDAMVSAVRAACREEPDVLIVEDLRTQELAALALDAAESGRLVFASVPGLSTPSALERLIELFPAERREKVQASLAGTLRGIVSQVLLRKLRGGRVAAREVLINTPAVAGLIMEGETFQLPAAIENGRGFGMISFADSLASLVREGTVHPAHAHRKAPNRDQFSAALRRSGVETAVAERLG
jgi:twitching motility protein PilT